MRSIQEKSEDRDCWKIFSLNILGNKYTVELCITKSKVNPEDTGIDQDNLGNMDSDNIFHLNSGVKIRTSRNGPDRRRLSN